jgi:hypothetical protein
LFDGRSYQFPGSSADAQVEPEPEKDGGVVAPSGDGGLFEEPRSDGGIPLSDAGFTFPDGGFPAADGGVCVADILTDPLNCGRCGHDCLGGQCVSGRCQPTTLAVFSKDRWYLAGTATTLYILGRDNDPNSSHEILKYNRLTKKIDVVSTEKDPFFARIAGNQLYWTTDSRPATFRRWALDGQSAVATVAELPAGQRGLEFVFSGDGFAFITTLNTLFRVNLSTGEIQDWGTYKDIEGVARVGRQLYFTSVGTTNQLWNLDIDSKVAKPIATFMLKPRRVIATADAVYVTGYPAGIFRIGRSTGFTAEVTRGQNLGGGLQGLATDDLYFYWSSGDSIFRTPIANFGLQFESLTNVESDPVDIFVDDKAIIWINRTSGELRQLAK